MASATGVGGKSEKSKKQSKVIILKLSPSLLSRFIKPESKASPPSASLTPVNGQDEPTPVKPQASGDNASESNSTPAPTQDAPTPSDGSKKRKAPGTGPRKSTNIQIDTMAKPRGKPGPKKKPRL